MRFIEHSRDLEPTIAAAIQRAITGQRQASRAANEMCTNLLSEDRLSTHDCDQLAQIFLNDKSKGPAHSQVAIRALCREEGRCLSGEEAQTGVNVYFRVVSLERLGNILREEKLVDTLSSAIDLIQNLVGLDAGQVRLILRRIPLGQYLIWSSFLLPHEKFWPANGERVEDTLCGLGIESDSSPMLVLKYKLPDQVLPRVPTFWDAYASDPWNPYFRVVPEGEPFGFTMQTSNDCRASARPEVVHDIIFGSSLVAKMEYLSDNRE